MPDEEVIVTFTSKSAFRKAPLEVIQDKIRDNMYASIDLMVEAYEERRKLFPKQVRSSVWDLQHFGKAITRFIKASEALAKEVKR